MTSKEYDLLCIGNAMVDIFADGSGCAFDHYDLRHPVQHIEMKKLKRILSELGGGQIITSGGGAANTAKIAGFLGTKVCFAGAVGGEGAPPEQKGKTAGPDEFGKLFIKELKAAGVKLSLSFKPSPTGACLYLNAGGLTRIAASPSAALLLSESDINENDLKKARMVLVDGFMLGRPGLVQHLLALAAKYGIVAALDLSSEAIAAEHAMECLEYAKGQDLILFMNEAEAAAFYKAAASGLTVTTREAAESEKNPPWEIWKFFQSLTEVKKFPIIIVKLGANGAICFAGGAVFRANTRPVIPKDSTGAGDAFCAAFLSAWLQNKTIPECAAPGNHAAGIILGVTGTQAESRQFSELAQMLNDQ